MSVNLKQIYLTECVSEVIYNEAYEETIGNEVRLISTQNPGGLCCESRRRLILDSAHNISANSCTVVLRGMDLANGYIDESTNILFIIDVLVESPE